MDNSHAESLQVAATQGLVGLAAYALVLAAFVRAFWKGRHREGAVAIFAGWVAYAAYWRAALLLYVCTESPGGEAVACWPRGSPSRQRTRG